MYNEWILQNKMHTKKLIDHLSSFVALAEGDKKLANEFFEFKTFAKNEVLVAYEKVATHMYFVLSGFIRVYHLQRGVEITNHLASENYFVTAYNSFTTKAVSEEVVQAITDCEVLGITKDRLSQLYKESHTWALFGLVMSERYLVFNNQRGKDLITLSAEEKYLKLMKEEPNLIHNVPLQYIASYIGIEPQTLSKIRRKILS